MSNSFRLNDDNEFLNHNLEDSHMKASRSMSTQQIISKLQQKNYNLKKQVGRIDRVLSSMKMQQKPRYGISLPEINPDSIKKQLQNAYKQIKIYEYEIDKRRNYRNSEVAYVEQVNKVQKVFKQKVQIHERLKREMLILKHQSKQLTKSLKNDNKKHEYESLQNKLSTDLKYYQQNLRQFEQKRGFQIVQLQKQRASIKEMQKEILKQNSNEFLEGIKNKIFKSNNSDHNDALSPSRSIYDIESQAGKQQSRVSKIQSQIEQVQQRTPQVFASLKNDIKLLKKMQTDYENKINLVSRERDQASEKNFRSRNKLLEIQFEIQTIQNNIAQLKKLIDPNMFKPKLMKTNQPKLQPAKKKGLQIMHNYQFLQIGEITKFGKRFSDRAIIAKFNSKIIALTLYQKQDTKQFVGFQATYKIQDGKGTIKKGNINTQLDLKKQPYEQESLKLQGQDYFKTIDLFSRKSKIIGISIVSSRNKILKLGDLSAERMPLSMKQSEYPMCLFGSTLKDGFQLLGVEIFQAQIAKQSS